MVDLIKEKNIDGLVNRLQDLYNADFSFLYLIDFEFLGLNKNNEFDIDLIAKSYFDSKTGLLWLFDINDEVAFEYYLPKQSVKCSALLPPEIIEKIENSGKLEELNPESKIKAHSTSFHKTGIDEKMQEMAKRENEESELKKFENFCKDFTVGIIPETNYFLLPAISGSDVIESLKLTDIEFRYYYEKRQKEEKEGTKSTDFGKLAHCSLLEPLKFQQKYIVSRFDDFRTKEAKDWKKSIENSGFEVEIVKECDFNKAAKMSVIIKNSSIKMLQNLSKAKTEFELKGVCELTGLKLKGRIDARLKTSDGSFIVIDYKTTSELNNFEKNYTDYKIYLKMAFYKYLMELNGMQVSQMFLIVQSTQEPFDYEVYEIPAIDLIIGKAEFQDGLKRIKEILSTTETKKEAKTIEMNQYTKRRLMQKYEITESLE